MRGDALASGARSAVFTGPRLKFSEGEMRDDLKRLTSEDFILKYHIAQREYDMLISTKDEVKVSDFAQEMKQRLEAVERSLALDDAQSATLRRDCFIEPFVAGSRYGRVIVDRDDPAKLKSKLALPMHMRKEKTLLPTTGHIIKAVVFDAEGRDISPEFLAKRILFGRFSGTPIMFKGYPTWIQLDLGEILSFVNVEDIQVEEEEVAPLV